MYTSPTSAIAGTIRAASGNFEIRIPPQPVGFWVIGGTFRIGCVVKPTVEQIQNHLETFGWVWEDY